MKRESLILNIVGCLRRYLIIFFLIASLLIVFLAYFSVRRIENQKIIEKNNNEVSKRVNAIKGQILENLSILKLIQAYIQKNQEISRVEFSNIVNPIIESNSSIQAIEWIPKVSLNKRPDFEARAVNDGYKNFNFKEFDDKGDIIKSTPHKLYYPVYYLEPFDINKKVFGFDLSTYSLAKKNLSAIDKFGFAFSTGLKLIQDSSEYGLVTYLPVYFKLGKELKSSFDENNILGYVAGVYKTSSLIKHTLSEFTNDIAIQIYDKTDPSSSCRLYSFIPSEFGAKFNKEKLRLNMKNGYYLSIFTISIANFSWEISFTSNYDDKHWRLSFIILIVGIFYAFILSTIIYFKRKASKEILLFNQQLKKELLQKAQYEKELKLTQEKFSKLYFSAPLPITFISLADRSLVGVNPEFEKQFGYSSDSIIGKTTKDIGLWINSNNWNNYYKIFSEKGEVSNYEADTKTVNGDVKTFLLSSNMIHIQGQDFIYTFFQDITERKKTELALKTSELKYREVFNSVNDAILICDYETGAILDANSKASELHKYSIEELKSIDLNILSAGIYPFTYEELSKQLNNSSKCNESLLIDWQSRDKEGNILWVEISFKRAIINHRNSILGVIRDISERKRIEKLFIESEFLLTSQFNNSNLGIALVSPEKLWTKVNKKFCETIGYSEEDLLGRTWIEHTYLEDANNEIPLFDEMLAGKIDGYEIDKRFITKDSSLVYTHISVSCFRRMDKSIYYIITYIFDITDRVEMENKILKVIIETEEYERTRFAQELHDGLGPLLSSIKMYTQWILKPGANLDQKDVLLQIENLANMANESVREIAFGLSPHILKDFGITEALNSFVDRIKLDKKLSIKINSNLSKRLDETTETIIYRILIECINNSLKHSHADLIRINLDRTLKYLNIEYKDNGIGFDLNKISDKRSGMGMYNIQNRLKSINGKLSIFSQRGKGTTIKIIILL